MPELARRVGRDQRPRLQHDYEGDAEQSAVTVLHT